MGLDDIRYPAAQNFDDMLSRKAAEPVVGVIRLRTAIRIYFRSGRLSLLLRNVLRVLTRLFSDAGPGASIGTQ